MGQEWQKMGAVMESASRAGRGEGFDGVYAGEVAGVISGEIEGWKAG